MKLPDLNVNQLMDQIEWSEVSERWRNGEDITAEEHQKFQGWGLWDQGVWAAETENACGSAYCQAGQAAAQAGYKMIMDDQGRAVYCRRPRGTQQYDIDEVAQKELGLTEREADLYFQGANDIDDLKALVNFFCERRGLPEPYPYVEPFTAWTIAELNADEGINQEVMV